MVLDRASGRTAHHRFTELPALLDGRDILARNNTRVIPARLIGRREATGGTWEGLFLRDLGDETWEILATTRGKPVPGERVVVGRGLRLVLEARGEAGRWIVRPLPKRAAIAPLERSVFWNVMAGRPYLLIFARGETRRATGRGIKPSSPCVRARSLRHGGSAFQRGDLPGVGRTGNRLG